VAELAAAIHLSVLDLAARLSHDGHFVRFERESRLAARMAI